jgi:hypothetical protein
MARNDELRKFFKRTDRPSRKPAKTPAPVAAGSGQMLGVMASALLLERRFDPYVDGLGDAGLAEPEWAASDWQSHFTAGRL